MLWITWNFSNSSVMFRRSPLLDLRTTCIGPNDEMRAHLKKNLVRNIFEPTTILHFLTISRGHFSEACNKAGKLGQMPLLGKIFSLTGSKWVFYLSWLNHLPSTVVANLTFPTKVHSQSLRNAQAIWIKHIS